MLRRATSRFKSPALRRILGDGRDGKRFVINIPGRGSPALQGTVLGIARGITDQDNPNGPQLLSSINPTFTWVRLAQRIPVGIHITHVPPGVLISAGMTCTVVMKEGAAPEIGLGIKKAVTAIFGTPSS